MNTEKMLKLLVDAGANPLFSNIVVNKIDKELYKNIVTDDTKHLKPIQEKRYDFMASFAFALKSNRVLSMSNR